MKFLTANEELCVQRLAIAPHHSYRIGNKLVGIKYGDSRPKYVLLDSKDLLELELAIKTDSEKLTSWIRRNLIHTLYHATDDS